MTTKISSSLYLWILALSMVSPVMADEAVDALDSARAGDYTHAAAAIKPLAIGGNPQAQFNLALLYHGGAGVSQNEIAAVVWYHKAAENGSVEAQEFLAAGYAEGWFGLPRDLERAKYWDKQSQLSH